jgi:hypothetical protein
MVGVHTKNDDLNYIARAISRELSVRNFPGVYNGQNEIAVRKLYRCLSFYDQGKGYVAIGEIRFYHTCAELYINCHYKSNELEYADPAFPENLYEKVKDIYDHKY